MLSPEDRTVGIIVDRNVLRSPPQEQREPVGEQKAHHRPQGRRPALDWADRCFGPIEGTHQRAHFAPAGEKRRGSGRTIGTFQSRHTRPVDPGLSCFTPLEPQRNTSDAPKVPRARFYSENGSAI